MITKYFLIVRIKNQSQVYNLNSLDQLEYLNLNARCKIIFNLNYNLQQNDFKKLTNIISAEPQFLSITFINQIEVQLINGICSFKIINLDSQEISQIFSQFLTRCIHITVKIEQIEHQQLFDEQVCSKIFDCLKQISIPDQKKLQLKDSDLIQSLKNKIYYNDLLKLLEQINPEIHILNLIAQHKYIYQYQKTNPQLVTYDLYSN
ncbi:hypothetical protein ABPG74_012494 [Tetrahymena malaccensis]